MARQLRVRGGSAERTGAVVARWHALGAWREAPGGSDGAVARLEAPGGSNGAVESTGGNWTIAAESD